MSEISSYYLRVPLRYLDEELKKWIVEEKERTHNPDYPSQGEINEWDDMMEIEEDTEGDLTSIKEKLFQLHIPYDYELESFDGDTFQYYYRPDFNDGEELEVTAKSRYLNEPVRYIATHDLLPLLKLSPEEAFQSLTTLLEAHDPQLPDLETYA